MRADITTGPIARRDVVELITGGWRSQALYTAIKLGLPDLIAAGTTTSAALADATGSKQDGIHRLLRFLVSVGVFEGSETKGYTNTALSEELLDDPNSLRDMCLLYGEECYNAWGHAHHAITTVTSGFTQAYDQDFYAYLGQNDDVAKRFQHVMNAQNVFADKVADVYDFSGGKTVVDVGGGGGELLSKVLHATPDARGVHFDGPHMKAEARAHMNATIGEDRVDFISGDMFKEVPKGGDVYLFSRVLAGWKDADIVEVLKNCKRAVKGTASRVIIIDRLVKDEGSTMMPALWDLHLLVTIGGRHRTLESFTDVLNKAGFAVESTADLPNETTAIIAAPKADC
jgi:hypothetical protein